MDKKIPDKWEQDQKREQEERIQRLIKALKNGKHAPRRSALQDVYDERNGTVPIELENTLLAMVLNPTEHNKAKTLIGLSKVHNVSEKRFTELVYCYLLDDVQKDFRPKDDVQKRMRFCNEKKAKRLLGLIQFGFLTGYQNVNYRPEKSSVHEVKEFLDGILDEIKERFPKLSMEHVEKRFEQIVDYQRRYLEYLETGDISLIPELILQTKQKALSEETVKRKTEALVFGLGMEKTGELIFEAFRNLGEDDIIDIIKAYFDTIDSGIRRGIYEEQEISNALEMILKNISTPNQAMHFAELLGNDNVFSGFHYELNWGSKQTKDALDKCFRIIKEKGNQEQKLEITKIYQRVMKKLGKKTKFGLGDVLSSGRIPRPRRNPRNRDTKLFRSRLRAVN